MEELADGLIKRIHVNMHNIRYNNRGNDKKPVISVKMSDGNHIGFEARILGPSKVVYSPDKPLSCGARMWVETTAAVELE